MRATRRSTAGNILAFSGFAAYCSTTSRNLKKLHKKYSFVPSGNTAQRTIQIDGISGLPELPSIFAMIGAVRFGGDGFDAPSSSATRNSAIRITMREVRALSRKLEIANKPGESGAT